MSSAANITNGDASAPAAKTITLRTSDGQLFDVEESIAMEFATVKSFLDDNSDEKALTVIPLLNVSAKYLSLILQYCKEQQKFRSETTAQEAKKAFEKKFVEELGNEEIKEMVLAVNYLDMKRLLELLDQVIADRIKDWTVVKVRAFFGIENDFTPEEEARIRQKDAWAHEIVED